MCTETLDGSIVNRMGNNVATIIVVKTVDCCASSEVSGEMVTTVLH